ncbi:DUF3299 domain-containing protein [Mitsuaria sp. 7]|uniref:DUF3299 domain-containing protein n=1 Tax=Mitsuaria sp. 7 TaxID=1658665 RepID=UPI0007DE2893|nr:DUF3299 domain-containing protein [Mitsuaria sp. 7]ANH68356.1 hypothetical protein ABE85_13685 [Mitsuaria sp. 7]
MTSLALHAVAIALAAALPIATARAAPAAQSVAQAASAPASGYRELTWIQLVPPGWDPMKRFRDVGIGRLSDNSPRTAALMADLRDELDNAPLVETLQDAPVRLPGYVVPLQTDRDGVREFLLVPYFGACIHMPPPPANQIILVKLAQPAKQLRSMDTVWASGVMRLDRQPSDMGVSGYRLDAASVEPYRNKPR